MSNGNPFEERTWSYRFYEEGFHSYLSDENPYPEGSFPWEIWVEGRKEKIKRINDARRLANLEEYIDE